MWWRDLLSLSPRSVTFSTAQHSLSRTFPPPADPRRTQAFTCMCRPTGRHTQAHAHAGTRTRRHTQAHAHAGTRTHRHTHTQAHAGTRTRRHTHTQAHAHAGARTRRHTHTQAHAHAGTRRDLLSQTHWRQVFWVMGHESLALALRTDHPSLDCPSSGLSPQCRQNRHVRFPLEASIPGKGIPAGSRHGASRLGNDRGLGGGASPSFLRPREVQGCARGHTGRGSRMTLP